MGVSVAVLDEHVTVAAIALPPWGVKVKVELVRVEAFIAALKVAVTVVVRATPVLAFVGVTAVTVGAGAEAVVKDQV